MEKKFFVAAVIIAILLLMYLLWPKSSKSTTSSSSGGKEDQLVKLEKQLADAATSRTTIDPRIDPVKYAANYIRGQLEIDNQHNAFAAYDSNAMFSLACIIVRTKYKPKDEVVSLFKKLLPAKVATTADTPSWQKWQNLFIHLVWYKYCTVNGKEETERTSTLKSDKSAYIKSLPDDLNGMYPGHAMLLMQYIFLVHKMSPQLSSFISGNEDVVLQKALYRISHSWFWVTDQYQFNPLGLDSKHLNRISNPLIHFADYVAGLNLEKETSIAAFTLPLPILTETEKKLTELGVIGYPFNLYVPIKTAKSLPKLPAESKRKWLSFIAPTNSKFQDYRFIEKTSGLVWQISKRLEAPIEISYYCGGKIDRTFTSMGPKLSNSKYSLAHLELEKDMHLFVVLGEEENSPLMSAVLDLQKNYMDVYVINDQVLGELSLFSINLDEKDVKITGNNDALVLNTDTENIHILGETISVTKVDGKLQMERRGIGNEANFRIERTASDVKKDPQNAKPTFPEYKEILSDDTGFKMEVSKYKIIYKKENHTLKLG